MAPGRYYIDTSAYLCLLLGEAGWQRLAGELDGTHLLSSALLALEAERRTNRRGNWVFPSDAPDAVGL